VEKIKPTEIYNLGAQSHVQVSFEVPEYTAEVDGVGTLRFLDAIKETGIDTKFYQASTSELFGKALESPQSEKTPFYPRSPYAAAKLYAYWITVNYREAYNLFACNGILFNHESERRGKTFVTRKISIGVSKIVLGMQDILYLGNLDSKRDWGYAPEFCEGMWKMLQVDKPDDYVLATGKTHSVREFVEEAFNQFGQKIFWEGNGIDEVGKLANSGKTIIKIDPRYFRLTEVELLQGDPSKAKNALDWSSKLSFKELVKIMVNADYKKLKSRNEKR